METKGKLKGHMLLDVHDVCELYNVSTRTVYRWIESGQLEGKKAGGQWRFSKEAVLKMLR